MAKAVSPVRRAAARSALSKTKNDSKPSKRNRKKPVAAPKKLTPLPLKKSPAKKIVKTSPKNKAAASPAKKSTRVLAKKVVIKSANSSASEAEAEEEIEDEISIGSGEEKEEKVVKSPKLKVKKSTLAANKKKTNAAKSPKKSPKKSPTKKDSSPAKSPSRSTRTRKVRPFNGAQRLASVAKKIFSVPESERPQAIVIEKAVFDPLKERRKRQPWTEAEIDNLTKGVKKHGEGAWAAILTDASLKFHLNRNQVDLKDKWRNMNAYVSYAGHPIRRFMLVDSSHQPLLSPAGNQHIFRNRWPRDAALKVATRDEFYPVDPEHPDGLKKTSIIVHLREIIDDPFKAENSPQIVHVYRATRILQRPRAIQKFTGYAAVWTGKVEKIAEEILIRSSEIMSEEQ